MLYILEEKDIKNGAVIICPICKGTRKVNLTKYSTSLECYQLIRCTLCDGEMLVKKEITLHDKLSVLGEYNNYQKVGPQEQEYLEEYGKWLEDNNYEVVKINRD